MYLWEMAPILAFCINLQSVRCNHCVGETFSNGYEHAFQHFRINVQCRFIDSLTAWIMSGSSEVVLCSSEGNLKLVLGSSDCHPKRT